MDSFFLPPSGNEPRPSPAMPPSAIEYQATRLSDSDGGRRPAIIMRPLMMLAGVDYDLALRCPPNEWRSMVLVGAGLLWGAAFTAFCVWIALGELFGRDLTLEGQALVTALATAVRFIIDRKFVSADWYAQGLTYAWSHGLIAAPSWPRRLKRSVGVGGRLAYSLAFSSLIAMVLMTIVFRDASHRKLVQENVVENAAVLNSANTQYERRVREIGDQVSRLEQSSATLELERSALLPSPQPDAARAQQIAKLTTQIESWRAAKAEAERNASAHESDRNAEKNGVRPRANNTGLEGSGRKYEFHKAEADRLRAEAAVRTSDIEAASHQLEDLRREITEEARRGDVAKAARVSAIDFELREIGDSKRGLLAERVSMQDGREAWVDRRMRAAPAYKPLPNDISDRLRILRALTVSSGLIFFLMIALEITIVAFESAGPIGKVFFTPPTHYAMWVALRLQNATDSEKDLRAELTSALRRRRRQRERAEAAEGSGEPGKPTPDAAPDWPNSAVPQTSEEPRQNLPTERGL